MVRDDAPNKGSVITIYLNGHATVLACTENSTGECKNTTTIIAVKSGSDIAATYTSATGVLTNQGMVMSLGFVGSS